MELKKLEKYLPEGALPFIKKWLKPYAVLIKITYSRSTKLGDYRPLSHDQHQISINYDLKPQLFFMVLTHEIAHLQNYVQYKRKVQPHGAEWKRHFQELLRESFEIYQPDFQPLLLDFIRNPKASYTATPEIARYFSPGKYGNTVGDLQPGSYFEYRYRKFQMIEKRKKHYLCKDLNTGKKYIFNALAEIKTITDEV